MNWRDQRPDYMTAAEARHRVRELAAELEATRLVWVVLIHYQYEGADFLGLGMDEPAAKRIAEEAHMGAPGSYARSHHQPLEWKPNADNGHGGWHTARVNYEWYTVHPCKVEKSP